MCKRRAHKTQDGHAVTLWLVALMLLNYTEIPVLHAKRPTSENIVIRTATANYDITETRRLFEEARIVASLRSGRTLELSQLSDFTDRYRVLTEHLHLRLMSTKAPRVADSAAIERLASKMVGGSSLAEALEKEASSPSSATAIQRLATRVGSTADHLKETLRLLIQREFLIDRLRRELPDAYMLINWYEQNLYVEFEALAVPRVPTSQEIDRAIGRHQPEITALYEKRRHRFNKPPRIMANRIRVPWSQPRTPSSEQQTRSEASALRRAREAGQAFDDVLKQTGDRHAIRKGGHVTLNATTYPSFATLPIGTRTPLVEDEVGVGFYEIKRHTPAFSRPLTASTVQRELAAEVLRETDQLPSANKAAQQLSDFWVSVPERLDFQVSRVQGARRIERGKFAPYASNQIPGIGLSEDGTAHIRELDSGKVSGQPVRIRQDYLVFKVLNWEVPVLADWWEQAPGFWMTYEPQARKNLIRSWLKVHGRALEVKVDKPTLAKMLLESDNL